VSLVEVERDEAVAVVLLNRPEALNALSDELMEELVNALQELDRDDSVRAIVLGGSERAFSAGADIREFVAPLVPVQFREQRRRVDFRQAMDRCPQPILEARFKARPRDAWLQTLLSHDIPAGPVHSIDEFRRHELTRHHGMAREYDHAEVGRLTLPGPSLLFSATPTRDVGPSPTLGQHTDDVLRAAGYTDAAVADLRARKIVR